jgi:MSHA biogenesis protein MshQ
MRAFVAFVMALFSSLVWAECSEDYVGLAVINEVADTGNFIEVKLLSSAISPEEYNQWTLDYCTLTGQGKDQSVECVGDGAAAGGLPLSGADSTGYPWLVLSPGSGDPDVNLNGIEIRLQDQNGGTIDYLRVYDGKSNKFDGSNFDSLTNDCSIATVIDEGGSQGKLTKREPDGAGDWQLSGGQSGGGTSEGSSNDGGNVAPDAVVGIDSVTVERGQVATLKVTLDETVAVSTTVSYRTRDDSAEANSDYVAKIGTVTIPANSTEATITVVTQGSPSQQSERFFVELTGVTGNVVLGSQIGVVTIMPAPVAWWRFEGNAEDETGSGLNGSVNNDVAFLSANPARPNSPGTCQYAQLDNSAFQYGRITVGEADPLDLDSELTIAGWVRREETGGGYILSKPDNYLWYVDSSGRFSWLWGSSGELRSQENVLAEGAWVHVAVTYRSGYQALYVNGELVNDSFFDGPLPTSNNELLFGRRSLSWVDLVNWSRFSGSIDEMRIYSEALPASAIDRIYNAAFPCAGSEPQLADFRITYDSAGSVCEPLAVRVEALDSSGATLTGYTGKVDLSTTSNHGTWSVNEGNGALSPLPDNSDDGQASYQFDLSDAGVATFALSNTHADVLSITGTDFSENVVATGEVVEFLENILRISPNDPLGGDLIAGREHQYDVSLIKRDDSGECGVATDYEGTHLLDVWLDRTSNDPGGAGPEVRGENTLQEAGNESGSGSVEVEFTGGQADLFIKPVDVGEYTVGLLDASSGYARDLAGAAIPIPSTSTGSPWTARPFALAVNAPGNPGATDANGGVFRAAGESFRLEVAGVLYDAADDSDGDGQAEPGANVWDNARAVSFGQEGESSVLQSTLLAPAGGEPDAFYSGAEPISSYSGGVGGRDDYRFDEVGIISVSARIADGSYLGASTARTGRMTVPSLAIGRFTPASLEVRLFDKGKLATSCSSVAQPFTYLGQPFGWQAAPTVRVIPRAVGGQETTNYLIGDFMKLEASGFTRSWPVEDSGAQLTDGSGAFVTFEAITEEGLIEGRTDGDPIYFRYSLADEFSHEKNAFTKVVPFDPEPVFGIESVTDLDGVGWVADPAEVSGTPEAFTPGTDGPVRYGRLELENVYGPETGDPLLMPFRATYWDGNRFVTNTDDSCSPWATSDITVTDPEGVMAELADLSGELEQGTAAPLELVPAGNRGEATLEWDVPVWLQDDWNQEDTLVNPSATATFGVYRGNDRIIYWREVSAN